MTLSPEIVYVAVLFVLFVLPRMLQRFGVPAAVTAFLLGAGAGLGLGLFHDDATMHLLAAFGVTALFLFAGLDVEFSELRRNTGVLVQHLVVRTLLLVGVAFGLSRVLLLDARVALLVSLAVLTPSTGFILDSLHMLKLSPAEEAWIKSKAIATEILALLVLFGTLQSTTAVQFAVSVAVLAGMVLFLPLLFRAFAAVIVPHAPRSEFAFLLMVAVICAFVTRELGAYYLVGAFVVGMAAQRFRERLPAIASEEMIHAVELFASFFIPFYFFSAGLMLRLEDFQSLALLIGGGLLVTMVPLRLLAVVVHRAVALGEPLRAGIRIALPMMPTLVFGLVVAELLRDRFRVPEWLFGGLILYTLATTVLPAIFLRPRTLEYVEPHAPHLPVEALPGPRMPPSRLPESG